MVSYRLFYVDINNVGSFDVKLSTFIVKLLLDKFFIFNFYVVLDKSSDILLFSFYSF
jgi:hypothetical protein